MRTLSARRVAAQRRVLEVIAIPGEYRRVLRSQSRGLDYRAGCVLRSHVWTLLLRMAVLKDSREGDVHPFRELATASRPRGGQLASPARGEGEEIQVPRDCFSSAVRPMWCQRPGVTQRKRVRPGRLHQHVSTQPQRSRGPPIRSASATRVPTASRRNPTTPAKRIRRMAASVEIGRTVVIIFLFRWTLAVRGFRLHHHSRRGADTVHSHRQAGRQLRRPLGAHEGRLGRRRLLRGEADHCGFCRSWRCRSCIPSAPS